MFLRWLIPIALLMFVLGCGSKNGESSDSETTSTEASATSVDTTPTGRLLQEGTRLAEAGELSAAIEQFEKVLEDSPNHPAALSMIAMASQQEGMRLAGEDREAANAYFLRSAEIARQLKERDGLSPVLAQNYPSVIYNEACCYALQGNTDAALASIEEALSAGLSDLSMVESDSDLESLRELDSFKSLIANAKEQARQRAIELANKSLEGFEPFPFSFELPDVDDESLSLGSLAGNVVIVDFWGTWCPPCRQEIPHFIDLYEKYHDQGLEIVGLTYERVPEDQVKSSITKFVEENGVNYPCVIGDQATLDQVPNFEGYPTTLFIDRDGTVRAKLVGYREHEELEAIVRRLLELDASK